MEIDHFIPWAYIASDEIWNLTPTFKSVNGKKSNDLPEIKDIDKMAEQHTRAFLIADTNSDLKKLKKEYLDHNLNNSDVRSSMYKIVLSSPEYKECLEKMIKPVLDSAINAGYRVWDKKGIFYQGS